MHCFLGEDVILHDFSNYLNNILHILILPCFTIFQGRFHNLRETSGLSLFAYSVDTCIRPTPSYADYMQVLLQFLQEPVTSKRRKRSFQCNTTPG